MLYRVLHTINAEYPLAVLWLYIAVFLLAFGFIFIFPQITLLLFFIALHGLAVVIVLRMALLAIERGIARAALRKGLCPRCGETGEVVSSNDHAECPRCGSIFHRDGHAETPEELQARTLHN